MGRSTDDLAQELISHINYVEKTRNKIEKLYSENLVVHRDVIFVYSGLFLEIVTSFEKFIEDLFVGILSDSIFHPSSKIHPRIRFKSTSICRDIIKGGRNYVDWLPYEQHTIKRGKAFFRNGLPFTSLTNAQKKAISKISIIRNSIAHKSSHSSKSFEKDVINGLPLLAKERTPIGYLRSVYIHFPTPQRRFDEIVAEIINISQSLSK